MAKQVWCRVVLEAVALLTVCISHRRTAFAGWSRLAWLGVPASHVILWLVSSSQRSGRPLGIWCLVNRLGSLPVEQSAGVEAYYGFRVCFEWHFASVQTDLTPTEFGDPTGSARLQIESKQRRSIHGK